MKLILCGTGYYRWATIEKKTEYQEWNIDTHLYITLEILQVDGGTFNRK